MRMSTRPIVVVSPLLAGVLGVSGGCLAEGNEAGARGPTIAFDSTQYEFGEVPPDTEVNGTLSYKNVGRDNLRVEVASTSCRFYVYVDSERVPAGKSGTVRLAFRTRSLPGEELCAGTLKTNDPATPEVSLSARAEVTRPISLSPAALYWRATTATLAAPQAAKVVGVGRESTVTVTSVPAWAEAKVSGSEEGTWVVAVCAGSGVSPGLRWGRVTLCATKGHREVPLALPLRLTVEGEVSVAPTTLFFGVVSPGQRVTRTVRLVVRPGVELGELVARVAGSDSVACTLCPPRPGQPEHTLAVRVTPTGLQGRLTAEVEILSADDGKVRLTVPVVVCVVNEEGR